MNGTTGLTDSVTMTCLDS